MAKADKQQALNQIIVMIERFCEVHFDKELTEYALKLCDKIGRKRTVDISRGRCEIWAAAIIRLIARLNFLFDPANEHHVTADTICDFFGVSKSTAGQKATLIEKTCKIRMGDPEFCPHEIAELFTHILVPRGRILPANTLNRSSA